MKKIIALGLVAAVMTVSACNTVSGIGRDVRAAGDAVAGAADDAKN
jgi:entericidin B